MLDAGKAAADVIKAALDAFLDALDHTNSVGVSHSPPFLREGFA